MIVAHLKRDKKLITLIETITDKTSASKSV